MELIADGLLIAAALTSALYCWVLSRRLNALKRMDKGLGGAIAGLSARVEQTRASLADTKASTGDITRELSALTARAEIAAGRLDILLATLQERPSTRRTPSARETAPARRAKPAEDVTERADAATTRPEGPDTQRREQAQVGDVREETRSADAGEPGTPMLAAQTRDAPAGPADGLSALRRIARARSGR